MTCDSITAACPEDAPSIVDMIAAAAKEGVFHSDAPSIEAFQRVAFENPVEGYQLLVCRVKDEIVGYVDSRTRRGVGQILGLYVKPDHRRKGIGTELVEKTLDAFKKRGCHKARLEVFADNHGAIYFYTRLKFFREGFLREDEEKRDTFIIEQASGEMESHD